MYRVGLYLVNRPNNGGSYQYWLAILKAIAVLDKTRYDVWVYSEFDDWLHTAAELGIENIISLKKRNRFGIFCERIYRKFPCAVTLTGCKIFDNILRKIKKGKFDLWISQMVTGTADLLSVPAMVPIFDLMHRYERDFPEVKEEYSIREEMYIHQCRTAKIILADSEVGKQQIVESYGDKVTELAGKVKVLPFIPSDYIYHCKIISDFKYELFDKYIFYPAQFWQHKNHKGLIAAVELLRRKGIDVNLVLVGSEQNNRENIETLIRKEGLSNNVKILGYVTNDEMVYLYQHARALVMPTFFGPTNIPQLEAFVLGCPVATSGIYGIPEQVGDAALLFDPNSVEEIADAIGRLWTDDDLCRELIRRGKHRAQGWGQTQFNDKVKKIINNYFEYEVS